ncbi:hypothetical protein COLO4_24374 [Corchorus olitorius]|uniref:Uncharacterized protein n=1 Tax=Corchorus olitorius TaxID=93759 RepID=A0A1R3IAM1_9ROSI|nr:hypothetical protein COLO4_24374 [Corchorus olitorius]
MLVNRLFFHIVCQSSQIIEVANNICQQKTGIFDECNTMLCVCRRFPEVFPFFNEFLNCSTLGSSAHFLLSMKSS